MGSDYIASASSSHKLRISFVFKVSYIHDSERFPCQQDLMGNG